MSGTLDQSSEAVEVEIGNLVISRRRGEVLLIGHEVEVTIVEIRHDKVRLLIKAPKTMPVHRKEVTEREDSKW